LRRGSKAKATRHSPSAAPNRISFKVGVSGAFQSVNAGAAQPWPKLLQHAGQREYFTSDILSERVEFRFKFVSHLNGPFHVLNMT